MSALLSGGGKIEVGEEALNRDELVASLLGAGAKDPLLICTCPTTGEETVFRRPEHLPTTTLECKCPNEHCYTILYMET